MVGLTTSRTFFKVLFKGTIVSKVTFQNLTFEEIMLKDPIRVDPNFIIQIKEDADKKSNFLFFQNIEEVLHLGAEKQKTKYNYYYVLLFTKKSNKNRKGVLIGNVKAVGDIIIGAWPIDFKLKKDFDIKEFFSELTLINSNPDKFSDVTLIN